MQRRRLAIGLTLLLITVLVIAGCAPRAEGGMTTELAGTEDLAVDMPALVIDFAADGSASVGDIPVAELGAAFAPGMLDALAMPPEQVAQMIDAGIQHLQISNSPGGLLILINGQPIPSIKWDGDILATTAGVASMFGQEIPVLEKLLPLVTHLGLGAIVRFPLADGVASLPTHPDGDTPAATASRMAQEDFLSTVGNPPTITIPVMYDTDGSWRVGDLSDAEWTNLTGMAFFDSMRMQPSAVESFMKAGIDEISLATDPMGIHIRINGEDLPYIGWQDGELNHVLALADQMGVWEMLESTGMNPDEIVTLVETLLPIVQASEISINAHFPKSVALAQ